MGIDRTDLAKIFPGHWDGGDNEFHGLVRAKGEQLRVECVRRDESWRVSVFNGGVATAAADDVDVRRAIATSLKAALKSL